jgi:hypothetical protein
MHAFPHLLYSKHVRSKAPYGISIAVDQILSRAVQFAFWNVNMNSPAARNESQFHPPYLKSYDVKKYVIIYH